MPRQIGYLRISLSSAKGPAPKQVELLPEVARLVWSKNARAFLVEKNTKADEVIERAYSGSRSVNGRKQKLRFTGDA